ncbi:MAG: DUF2807 domain-containing protein [Cytophagales bacterium]|nr:DUF2807 domain-containing protein [Cytophagales bacterium]
MMKNILVLTLLVAIVSHLPAQKNVETLVFDDLGYFNKVSVGPMINLELIQGDRESAKIEYKRVEQENIIVKVTGKTLKVYLDKAKMLPERRKEWEGNHYRHINIYRGARITAYVTVRDLKRIEARGEERVYSAKPLIVEKLKIKAYGEANIYFSSLKADRLKVVMYGANDLEIREGIAKKQVIKGYGDTFVDNMDLLTDKTKVGILGESEINVNAKDYLRLSSLGETVLKYDGVPRVNRWFTIGENQMYRVR